MLGHGLFFREMSSLHRELGGIKFVRACYDECDGSLIIPFIHAGDTSN